MFRELASLCERHGLTLQLERLDYTNRPVKSDWLGEATLRVRVVDQDGQIIVGRIQSDQGCEPIDELARLCLLSLRQRGLVG